MHPPEMIEGLLGLACAWDPALSRFGNDDNGHLIAWGKVATLDSSRSLLFVQRAGEAEPLEIVALPEVRVCTVDGAVPLSAIRANDRVQVHCLRKGGELVATRIEIQPNLGDVGPSPSPRPSV